MFFLSYPGVGRVYRKLELVGPKPICTLISPCRPKSGSGDQNKQIVPSVETVGWTATEVIAFNTAEKPVGPYILYNSGCDDANK